MPTDTHTPPNDPAASIASELPIMSSKEVSWHETIAGLRAKTEALKDGAAPTAIESLLSASTAKEVTVGPITLKRVTKGAAMVLRLIGEAFKEWIQNHSIPTDQSDLIEDGIATIVFMDAEAAYNRFIAHGIEPFIVDADKLTWQLDVEHLAAINRHVYTEMDRLQQLNSAMNGNDADEVPGKHLQTPPATPAGHSAENQNPPSVKTSPVSNGSCQNTSSASTPPSGNSPLSPPSSSSQPVTNGTDVSQDQATPSMPASTPAPAPDPT